jgi:TIR domain/Tetratricopeptide repeat/NB-ARC domain
MAIDPAQRLPHGRVSASQERDQCGFGTARQNAAGHCRSREFSGCSIPSQSLVCRHPRQPGRSPLADITARGAIYRARCPEYKHWNWDSNAIRPKVSLMKPGRHDFFISRRGSVAAVAQSVERHLTENGYTVLVQDYDIPYTADFIEAMHEAIKSARDLIVLYTRDYEEFPHTRKEFTSFLADASSDSEERRVIVLRCEDVALRGLFAATVYQDLVGVSDPNEQRDRIIAAVQGRSQALRPPPRPFVGVPPRIANFTGREAVLDRIDQLLNGSGQAPNNPKALIGRVAIHGLGGIGKTTIAIEYAHRFRDLYAGVHWCSAETRAGLVEALAALGRQFGAQEDAKSDPERTAAATLSRLSEQRATWLLIYDNVHAPDDIAELLPQAGARVLITSRFSDWANWADEIVLDVFSPADAEQFLLKRADRRAEAGTKQLAQTLGYLPLALDHAAAYCRRAQIGFADYAAKAASLISSAPRAARNLRSVAATFTMAIEAVIDECPTAEKLIAFLAYCAPQPIPLPLISHAFPSDAQRDEAIARLSEASLLKHERPPEDSLPAGVVLHRVVQTVARSWAEERGLTENAVSELIASLSSIYPPLPASIELDRLDTYLWYACSFHLTSFRSPELQREWQRWLTVLPDLPAFKVADEEAPILAETFEQCGWRLSRFHFSPPAEPFLREALVLYARLLGPDNPELATILTRIGRLMFFDLEDVSWPRSLLEQALAIRTTALGPEDPATADSLIHLGQVLLWEREYVHARRLTERALRICEAAHGPDHDHTIVCVEHLADVVHKARDFGAARTLYERVLAYAEETLGPEHPATARALVGLGGVLRDQNFSAHAKPLLQRALAIREKTLGQDHPDTREVRELLDTKEAGPFRIITRIAERIWHPGKPTRH